MIACHWKELNRHAPVIGRIVSDFMSSHDIAALVKGRIDLQDGCYVNVDEYDTRDNPRFEAHRLYADVQVLLTGNEQIFVAPLLDGAVETPYNPDKDITFYTLRDERPFFTAELQPETAVLLMPWDLHAPCNAATPSHNHKLIFKIPIAVATDRTGERIACCGDSITFGLGATSSTHSYPAVLQTLMGDHIVVGNFGRNGATGISDFGWRPDKHSPYCKAPQYAAAMVSEPTTVVLMLGMNDGNPTHCFNEPNGGPMTDEVLTRYVNGMKALIENFRALPSAPRILLATTTHMCRQAGEQWIDAYVHDFNGNLAHIRAAQQQLADIYGLPLIDTLTDMNNPAFYKDGCHLTDAGYQALARRIRQAL